MSSQPITPKPAGSEDKFYHARITKRLDLAGDLWVIRVEPQGDFTFVPGQYATLGVNGPVSGQSVPIQSSLLLMKKNSNFSSNLFPKES